MLASSSRGRRSACSSCGLLIEQPANATPSSSLLDRWSTAACRAVHALQSCARQTDILPEAGEGALPADCTGAKAGSSTKGG